MIYRRAWAEINLPNITHNLRAVRRFVPKRTRIMGIVKADGYGHGLAEAGRTMLAGGADALGVAICEEGIALREAGITAPILVMGFTPAPLLSEIVWRELTQTVFNRESAAALSAAAKQLGKRAAVHIKIDTGMSRLGFLPKKESLDAICEIARDEWLMVDGIYTHCATSDALENEFVFEQQRRFVQVLEGLAERGLDIRVKHMANSGAVVQQFLPVPEGVDTPHTDLFMDIVRVGILLYGLPPSHEMQDACRQLDLKPAMRLFSQVSMVKQLDAGVGISYGHLFTTARPTTIAVIPVGYADGFPRRLTHGGRVIIKGQHAPIVGAICMDQCMVDVTDIPGVTAGTTVTMLCAPTVQQEQSISADDLADTVGTISYEIICGIGKRVPRVYIHSN